MCGIIGISSNKSVSANIINSLKKLEYRGYDSAGIATLFDGEINEVKSEGRVDNLEQNFDLNEIASNETKEVDLNLAKIETGVTIVLNNIFFDFDKAELKTASYPELNRLLKYLNDGDIKKIEISGHTDSVGEDDYNKGLSERRAKAVFNFFRENGIAKDRLVSVGYGETKPKVANDTKENRAKNRRVEFKVVE